jgi:hypothetical protein
MPLELLTRHDPRQNSNKTKTIDSDKVAHAAVVISMSRNAQGHYVLDRNRLTQAGHYIIKDGEQIIAEINNDGNELKATFLTNQQIDLQGNIHQNVELTATGPVCFLGNLQSANAKIQAKSLLCCGAVNCKNLLRCDIEKAVVFDQIVSAGVVVCNAKSVKFSDQVNADNLNLALKSKIIFNKNVNANNQIRLKAAKICNKGKTTAKLISGELTEKLQNLGQIEATTHLAIKQAKGKKVAIDNHGIIRSHGRYELSCDQYQQSATAISDCRGDFIGLAKKLTVAGDFLVAGRCFMQVADWAVGAEHATTNIRLNSNTLTASPQPDLPDHYIHLKSFDMKGDTTFSLGNSAAKQGSFIIDNIGNVAGKKLQLQKTKLQSKQLVAKAGEFFTQDTHIKVDFCQVKPTAHMVLAANSHLQTTQSVIVARGGFLRAQQAIVSATDVLFDGDVSVDDTLIHAQRINGEHGQGKFSNSQLQAVEEVNLSQPCDFKKVNIKADNIVLQGNKTKASLLQMQANQIDIVAQDTQLQRSMTKSRFLNIGDSEGQTTTFKNCSLQTEALSQSGTTVLQDSTLLGLGDNENSHSISGKLKLKNSKFIGKSQVFSDDGSSVTLLDKSSLKAKTFYSTGTIKLERAQLLTDEILKFEKDFESKQSQIVATASFHAKDTKLELTQGTTLETDFLNLDTVMTVRDSKIKTGKTSSHANSAMEIDNSELSLGNATLAGDVVMQNTRFSADKVQLYKRFCASQDSSVMIANDMQVNGDADLSMTDSQLHANTLQQFGKLNLGTSQAAIKQKLTTHMGSTTELNASTLKSDTMEHGGNIKAVGHQNPAHWYTDTETKDNSLPESNHNIRQARKEHMRVVHPNRIEVANTLTTQSHSEMQVQQLAITAKEIEHAGKIQAEQQLTMQAKKVMVSDSGSAASAGELSITADDELTNSGSIRGAQVNLEGDIVTNYGLLRADHSLDITALMTTNLGAIYSPNFNVTSLGYVNAGIVSSYNYNVNTVARANLGLEVPSIPSWNDLFNRRKLFNVGKMMLTSYCPLAGSAYNVIYNGYSFCGQAGNLRASLTSDDFTQRSARQYLKTVFALKNTCVSAFNCVAPIYEAATANKEKSSDGNGNIEDSGNLKEESSDTGSDNPESANGGNTGNKFDFYAEAKTAAVATFAPMQNNETIFDINAGASVSHSISHTSMMDANFGAEFASGNYTNTSLLLYNGGSMSADNMTLSGRYFHQAGHAQADKMKMEFVDATLSGTTRTAHTNFKIGNDLTVSGELATGDGQIEVGNNLSVEQTAAVTSDNLTVKAKNAKVAGNWGYQNALSFDVENQFSSAEKSHFKATESGDFRLKAATENMQGQHDGHKVSLDVASMTAEQANDALAQRGRLGRIKASEKIAVTTKEHVDLTGLDAGYGVELRAKSVKVHQNTSAAKGIRLASTEGDIDIDGNMTAQQGDIAVESAGNLTNRNNKLQGKNIRLQAKKRLLNENAQQQADDEIFLKGKSVTNKRMKVDRRSTIEGDRVTIIAEDGDIHTNDNIKGRTFVYAHAKNGSIEQDSFDHTVQAEYDKKQVFEASNIIGGAGDESTEGIGVILHADKKYINRASNVAATGDVHIHGDEEVRFEDKTSAYVADEWTKKHGFFKQTTERGRRIDPIHAAAKVVSGKGKNVITSEKGKVKGTSVEFAAAHGTHIVADQDITFQTRVVESTTHKRKDRLWGALPNNARSKTTQQYDCPTRITNFVDGEVRVHSENGRINAEGTKILGTKESTLFLKAKKGIHLKQKKLQHRSEYRGTSYRLNIAGNDSEDLARGRFRVSDPLIDRVQELAGSNHPYETGANAINTGIEAFNTASQLASNPANFAARYTSAGVTVSQTRSKQTMQTAGQGGIANFGRMTAISEEGDIVFDGIDVTDVDSGYLKAKRVIQKSVSLEQSQKTQTDSVGASFNFMTLTPGGSAAHQHQKSKSTIHQQQKLQFNQGLHIEADEWQLHGAATDVRQLTGDVGKIYSETKLNSHQQRGESYSATSSGGFSANKTKLKQQQIGARAGIHVRGHLNKDAGNTLKVGATHLKGASITAEGENHYMTTNRNITAEAVKESANGRTLGIGGNAKDLNPNTQSSDTIPTVTINYGRVQQEGTLNSVIHGAQGTFTDSSRVDGVVVTDRSDGYTEHKNVRFNVKLNVPAPSTSPEKIKQAATNIQQSVEKGAKRLMSLLDDVNQSPSNSEVASVTLADRRNGNGTVRKMTPAREQAEIKQQQRSRNTESAAEQPEKPAQTAKEQQQQKKPTTNHKKRKLETDTFNPDTHSTRMSRKTGGGGKKQLTNTETQRYTTFKKEVDKIKQQNKDNKSKAELKIKSQIQLFEGEEEVRFQADSWFEGDHLKIQPTLRDNNGKGYFKAEIDPNKRELSINLEAERQIRLNILEGEQQLPLGTKLQFSVDAASATALAKAGMNTDRGFNAYAEAELGVMGPSASGQVKLPAVNFLGLRIEVAGKGSVGVGAKASLGGGVTVDKTKLQLRPYAKVGIFAGAGAEVKPEVGVGVDVGLMERTRQNTQELANSSLFKPAIDSLEKEIAKSDDNSWRQMQLREVQDDMLESVASMGFYSSLISVESGDAPAHNSHSGNTKL